MKIDRLITVIMILLERKKVTIPELARTCGVTTRTIQRDLDAINLAGVPVVSYPGVGGGVGIAENYRLEKRLFSTADVVTLLMGLGSVRSSLDGDNLANALARIKGVLPEEQRENIELRAGQITIDTTPWPGGRGQGELVALLQSAMEESRLIRFGYIDRKLQKTMRMVESYRLILKDMRWYFEGFCRDRQAFRIFKLTRMSDVVLLNESFEQRDFKPRPVLRPVFDDRDVVLATLRVRETALEQLTDLFGPGCLEPENGNTWIARIPVVNKEHDYRFLLRLGRDCECLAPESLRRGLVQYLEGILALYAEGG